MRGAQQRKKNLTDQKKNEKGPVIHPFVKKYGEKQLKV